MIASNEINISKSQRETNKIYFENRKEIKNLIKNINTCLDNNSSTFFLSIFYMDLIFENYTFEEIMSESNTFDILSDNFYAIKHYVLLSLACLVVSSKFSEKDPHVPDLNSFLRVYNKYSKFYFIFSLNELMNAEVKVIKLLKYKLNYYSLYQFITFFFSNGILFEKNIQDSPLIQNNKYSEKKILEKIYVKSREILDLIIDDYSKYNILFNGRENYITAIEILLWSIENILKIQIINNKSQIFSSFYNINIKYNKHIEIYSIIYNILNKDENMSDNINNNIINHKYNFNYGNLFLDFEEIEKKKNQNLSLIQKSNSINNINSDNIYRTQEIFNESKKKKLISYTILEDKINDKNSEFLAQTNENKINQESIPIKKAEHITRRKVLSRNISKELNININERKKNFQNMTKNNHNSKNINNFNEMNPNENNKNSEKDNNFYNFDFIEKKLYKEGKWNNKRNINAEYNNSSIKSTYLKDYFNQTNPSPKNILNKTKKIFDKTNRRKIKYENKDIESSMTMYNDYINKTNCSNNLKNNNFNRNKIKIDKSLNNYLSDNNFAYKIKNDYILNKISKLKENKNKENTIIINNNIQINNYFDKENTLTNYYNNSQQIISNIENINFENYINKKYFNIDKNNKNIYLSNNTNKQSIRDKNRKKFNFKKINIIEEINNNLKESNINYNNFNIITKRDKENLKVNKDKNNRILNIGKFQTYFDYSTSINSSQENFSLAKHINFNF